MTFTTLKRSPLADLAVRQLHERLASGQWPVGSKLPTETELAGQLGVGRSTVREAVRALVHAGMLETRQGSGTFVLSLTPDASWESRLRQAAILEIYEVREALEIQAARLAAERRTDSDVAVLRACLASRDGARELARDSGGPRGVGPPRQHSGGPWGAAPPPQHSGGPRSAPPQEHSGGPRGAPPQEHSGVGDAPLWQHTRFVEADLALHRAVVAAAHNLLLAEMYDSFASVLREALVAVVTDEALDEVAVAPTHARLVAAIAAGDADAAELATREHISSSSAALRKLAGQLQH